MALGLAIGLPIMFVFGWIMSAMMMDKRLDEKCGKCLALLDYVGVVDPDVIIEKLAAHHPVSMGNIRARYLGEILRFKAEGFKAQEIYNRISEQIQHELAMGRY